MSGQNSEKLNTTTKPVHIAFIMDGNGRWAKKRGLPRTFGHDAGTKTLEKIINCCFDRGIEYITFYAFSTENWSRPKNEVDHLMKLFESYLDYLIKKTEGSTSGIYALTRLRFIGDLTVLSNRVQEKIGLLEKRSMVGPRSMTLSIAVNYGGRDDIVHAVNRLIESGNRTKITAEDISANLFTRELPDPDLIIRTGGEMRLSNFLLWQAAYTEFYSTHVLWPDFSGEDLDKAISDFSSRERRFGNIK